MVIFVVFEHFSECFSVAYTSGQHQRIMVLHELEELCFLTERLDPFLAQCSPACAFLSFIFAPRANRLMSGKNERPAGTASTLFSCLMAIRLCHPRCSCSPGLKHLIGYSLKAIAVNLTLLVYLGTWIEDRAPSDLPGNRNGGVLNMNTSLVLIAVTEEIIIMVGDGLGLSAILLD
jgi:hypothetical protein